MKLGLYTFAALTFIAMIGVFTYSINSSHFIVELIGFRFNLPVAVWVILPLILFFLFTLGHMLFHGLRNYLKIKKWQKDMTTLEDALYWSLLNEPKDHKYHLEEVGHTAMVLNKSSLSVSDNVESVTPKLSRVINMIQKIKNGTYIDLKEEKMEKVFNDGNPLLIQNRLNCLESNTKFVENVMKNTAQYSLAVQEEALATFARKATFTEAVKFVDIFDIKNFLVMLSRVSSENDIGFSKENLLVFVKSLSFACVDYIKIAQVTKKYFRPDENLLLFASFQEEELKAQNAYLYLLFEYELVDQVGAYLEEQEVDEFIKFRALYQLKSENKKYKLEDIIDIHSVCNETRFF